ncbi:MAG: BolA/IbaG family iron-sulfur metabolism protein [Gammaproteobacteria bacterium]
MTDSQSKQTDTEQRLQRMIQVAFEPSFLAIENESHQHAGPARDSHFKLTVVSKVFENQRALARHRAVYEKVAALMPVPIHALALHTYTEAEWAARTSSAPTSPRCRGGA